MNTCPQCGDPTYLAGYPCDGCWHQMQDMGPKLPTEGELAAIDVYEALGGGLDLPACHRLAEQGFRAA